MIIFWQNDFQYYSKFSLKYIFLFISLKLGQRNYDLIKQINRADFFLKFKQNIKHGGRGGVKPNNK